MTICMHSFEPSHSKQRLPNSQHLYPTLKADLSKGVLIWDGIRSGTYGSEKRSPVLGWDLEMLACDWLKQGRSHLKSGLRIQTHRHQYVLLLPRLTFTAFPWLELFTALPKKSVLTSISSLYCLTSGIVTLSIKVLTPES